MTTLSRSDDALVLDAKDLMRSTRPTGTNADVESAGCRANSALTRGGSACAGSDCGRDGADTGDAELVDEAVLQGSVGDSSSRQTHLFRLAALNSAPNAAPLIAHGKSDPAASR